MSSDVGALVSDDGEFGELLVRERGREGSGVERLGMLVSCLGVDSLNDEGSLW